jgi:hypothetical protein
MSAKSEILKHDDGKRSACRQLPLGIQDPLIIA